MTKSLQEIQQENRKFILEAIHGCSYEEALKKEVEYNCEVLAMIWGKSLQRYRVDNLICYFDGDYLRFRELVGDISKKDLTEEGLKNLEDYESTKHRIIEIIGKPITLSRVLLAFKNKDVKIYNKSLVFSYEWESFYPLIEDTTESAYPVYKLWNLFSFDWDLTKETLEEQSEETQRRVNKLLTGE